MRKYMTKEVTTTTIKLAKVTVDENGLPVVEQLEPYVKLGTINKEKAQKLINKEYGLGVTVFGMEENTYVYKMKVADFIKVAELVQDENDTSLEEEEEEDEE